MLLKELKLNNIRSYIEETITFSEGSTLLSGDIGSGSRHGECFDDTCGPATEHCEEERRLGREWRGRAASEVAQAMKGPATQGSPS